MARSHDADKSFPYVLMISTLGTIISLGGVWITALTFAYA